MFRVMRMKDGSYCLETNLMAEALTDYTGTTTFIHCTLEQLDQLHAEIWPELLGVEDKRARR